MKKRENGAAREKLPSSEKTVTLGLRKQRQEDADSEAIAISRGKLVVSIDCSSILREFSMVEMTEGR